MKLPALLLVVFSGFSGSAFGQGQLVTGFADLPQDARGMAQRSVACQHFWGKVNGSGDERDLQVTATLGELKCDRIARISVSCAPSTARINGFLRSLKRQPLTSGATGPAGLFRKGVPRRGFSSLRPQVRRDFTRLFRQRCATDHVIADRAGEYRKGCSRANAPFGWGFPTYPTTGARS